MSNQVASNKTTKYSQSIYGAHLEYVGTLSVADIPNTDSIIDPDATTVNSIGLTVNADHYVVPSDMTLLITTNVTYIIGAGNIRIMYVAKPHTSTADIDRFGMDCVSPLAGSATGVDGTTIIDFLAGDTFAVRGEQDTAGPLGFATDSNKIKMIRLS